jgi:hypothetical protein
VFGPIRQRSPIVVVPEIVVLGSMIVPSPISTPGSMNVVFGEIM